MSEIFKGYSHEISLVTIPDQSLSFYDLNAICETADSIFWTLVPNEMFDLCGRSSYTYDSEMSQNTSVFDW